MSSASPRLVVLGGGGLLGRHLLQELGEGRAVGLDHAACDITRLDAVLEATRGAGVIVNCAAYTNVDGAESEEDRAFAVNALGAENVALAAERHGAKAVHISTDFIFDGAQARPYDEFDTPRPLSAYGRSKLGGEQLFLRSARRGFVVRVQGLYGAGGSNFSSKLIDLVRQGRSLKLDDERQVQPTWARAAARQIVRLSSTEAFGVYHVSCGGETTWAGFARALCAQLGVPESWSAVRTDELKAPAPRPPRCVFDRRMLRLRGLDAMPAWQEALAEFVRETLAAEDGTR